MKHFVLFFLSDIHLGKTGQFIESPYESYDRKRKYQCIQTNESAIDYLMDYLGNNLDGLYYFSSKKTKESNPIFKSAANCRIFTVLGSQLMTSATKSSC